MDVSYQLHTLVTLSLGERAPCCYWIGEREGPREQPVWCFGEKKTFRLLWIEPRFVGFPHRNFDSKRGGDKDHCDNDVEKKGEGREFNY